MIVAVAGMAFALVASQVSPRGLKLSENYFPGERPAPPLVKSTNQPGGTTNTNPLAAAVDLSTQLQANGLQLADSNLVVRLFNDPRYAMELILFIDAREDKYFQEGHIPSAYQLDPYHKENYLPTVLPACNTADQIVVYCTGGDCPDSLSTAIILRDANIPGDKLFVYGGGIHEWMSNSLPVEIGARKSGVLRTNAAPAVIPGAKL